MRALAIAIVLAGLATPAAAADDPLLARLAGEWIGRGLFRQGPDAETENIYCKITNTLSDDGTALAQTGRCATADHTAKVEMTITAEGTGRYTGAGSGLGVAARGQATFTGTGTANHLDLTATLVDTETEETSSATATIDVSSDGKYVMRAYATDEKTGTTYVASEIIFAAQ